MIPKGHGDLRGRRELLYEPKARVTFTVALTWFMAPKGHGDLYGRFDPVYDPKGLQGF